MIIIANKNASVLGVESVTANTSGRHTILHPRSANTTKSSPSPSTPVDRPPSPHAAQRASPNQNKPRAPPAPRDVHKFQNLGRSNHPRARVNPGAAPVEPPPQIDTI
jgi:hypothetical protein